MLEPLYAVENTLRAFARVRETHPEARLVVTEDENHDRAVFTASGLMAAREA